MDAVQTPNSDEFVSVTPVQVVALADFEETYRTHHAKLVSLAFVLTNSRTAAEDLVADAFADAYRNWGRVGRYEDPVGWLRRVIINRSVSRRRRLGVQTRGLLRLGRQRSKVVDIAPADSRLWAAVRKLPKRQAQLIALRYVADLSEADAAEHLGIGFETARTHLKRARQRLALVLDENGELK